MQRWVAWMRRWRWRPTREEIRLERNIALLLRIGVSLATVFLVAGLALYLLHNPSSMVGYHVFKGEPPYYRAPPAIIDLAFHGRGRALIQLGLLVLIATPLLRVILTLFAFAFRRDWLYVLFASIVLAVLLYGFSNVQWHSTPDAWTRRQERPVAFATVAGHPVSRTADDGDDEKM
ncbi:hypothetical protein GCM10022631_09420 [Deinococcus rubellus]|uniref:DUF1634 domain-containing protein n=1 Tax=Deinococcus rubellus TaxID=1889240 RepID=UPI0031F08F26